MTTVGYPSTTPGLELLHLSFPQKLGKIVFLSLFNLFLLAIGWFLEDRSKVSGETQADQ